MANDILIQKGTELRKVGAAMVAKGEYEIAANILMQLLDTIKENWETEQDDPRFQALVASTVTQLAKIELAQDNMGQALSLLDGAVDIWTSMKDKDWDRYSYDRADTAMVCTRIMTELGQFKQAADMLSIAIEGYQAAGDEPDAGEKLAEARKMRLEVLNNA